jgi:hypothetical protein
MSAAADPTPAPQKAGSAYLAAARVAFVMKGAVVSPVFDISCES